MAATNHIKYGRPKMNVANATVPIKTDPVSNLPAALIRVVDGCMITVWTITTVLLADCVVLGEEVVVGRTTAVDVDVNVDVDVDCALVEVVDVDVEAVVVDLPVVDEVKSEVEEVVGFSAIVRILVSESR